jgi:hypothetical protein
MDDFKYAPGAPAEPVEPVESAGSLEQPAEAAPESKTESAPDAPAAVPAPETPVVSEAVVKFRSCRWRATPEDGEFCTHRDVLPFAGKEGFVAESWCPDCAFYKLRRTPKKRERLDFTY